MNIIVLGTNISNHYMKSKVDYTLLQHPSLYHWSVDMEDIDRVLRIEAKNEITEAYIIDILNSIGYQGIPLPE